ncbi:hypothetical protein [Microseira sp. BLCC-F43]|uniref:hypothetical protein n=1 Tax=Microseira sp. BLCC-F43 TaxID=3153602 RepID=UPI0035B913DD
MWLVVRYQYASSPEVVAMFDRCCQAIERATQLSAEFPQDRFFTRLERNFLIRSIDDISTSNDWRNRKPKTKKLDKHSLRRW